MTRGRIWLTVAVVLVVTLLGLGLWRRAQLIDQRDAARTARARALTTLASTRRTLARTSVAANSLEADTAVTRKTARELTAIGDSLAGQITAVQKQRDDAAVRAWVAGGEVKQLRECLAGITRALNQVGVGDPSAATTLGTVRRACRAVSE